MNVEKKNCEERYRDEESDTERGENTVQKKSLHQEKNS